MSSFYRSRLLFGAAALVAVIPSGALLILLQEIWGLSGSWTWYVSGFLFYTILVFINAYFEDDSILFSSEDNRSKLTLLAGHCICLLVLFALIQFGIYIQRFLPHSILSGRTKRGSWAEFLFVAALMSVFFVEENWLAVREKKTGHRKDSARLP